MVRFFLKAASVIMLSLTACGHSTMTLEERLATLPVDTIIEIKADSMFKKAYDIRLIQPVDHRNPDGPKFSQQVFLYYVDPEKPVVVETEGYSARSGKSELADIFQCNQIRIEHRYFEESTPDPIDWKYLTTWQAATDDHRIIELFKPVFRGKWLTTGISKGGQTVMYHRYYYPDDVDVSVPYVGPLNFGPEDSRFRPFLDTVGTVECREKVYDFQKLALQKFDVLYPMFLELAREKGWTFTRVGSPEIAYETAVLEYEFGFWQWGSVPCDSIPLTGTDRQIFDHLSAVAGFRYFSDQGIAYFEPFFYQAMTQLGYYGYDFDRFRGLLKYAHDTGKPDFMFSAPQGIDYVYDYDFAKQVDRFIREDARRFIFLYGGNDPWRATAADPGDNKECIRIIREGGSHGTRIRNLPPEQQELVITKLEEWLGTDAVNR
jgi:hypothetical protein